MEDTCTSLDGPRAVPGVRVGHAEDLPAATGCTVILTEGGAICGVDQRGGAPSTRETDLLRPMHLVDRVHAVVLSGGSAFGLAAADGVMSFLEERGCGFDVGVARVPIVPAASLFDLAVGRADVRPDAAMGYAACRAAADDVLGRMGTVGAGTGATVGHILGQDRCTKGGLGAAVHEPLPGLFVGAVIAVNCFGEVADPRTGAILAGARTPEGGFADTLRELSRMPASFADAAGNTTIGVVITNATLSKEAAGKVAQMAHNGLALTIRPPHTMFDGDTIFVLATCKGTEANVNTVGAFAAQTVAEAVVAAVTQAESLAGIPALRELRPGE